MSITVTEIPFAIRFSATSRPMNPPPTTTARLHPRSSAYFLQPMASWGVRTVNTPGSPVPSTGGMELSAPTAMTSLSYFTSSTSRLWDRAPPDSVPDNTAPFSPEAVPGFRGSAPFPPPVGCWAPWLPGSAPFPPPVGGCASWLPGSAPILRRETVFAAGSTATASIPVCTLVPVSPMNLAGVFTISSPSVSMAPPM